MCSLNHRFITILSLFLAVGILSAVSLHLSSVRSAASIQEELSGSLLRLHIVANSDSDADQQLKLLVRDAILETYGSSFTAMPDKSDALCLADTLLADTEALANQILTENGSSDRAHASLEHCYFPEKTYDCYTFPAGYYDALRITIGKASGHNWWCILYPPLCFTELSAGELPESSRELLEQNLSIRAYESLLSEDDRNDSVSSDSDTTDTSVHLRFRLFPFLNQLFHLE